MKLNTILGKLRLTAYLEGISYLLLGITMPLKYMLDMPLPNYIVGMAHGVLFVLYLLLCILCIRSFEWNWKESLLVLVASLVPLGTFYADYKVLKPEEVKSQ